MNIVVKPYGKNQCYCRPDTTWERENKDFYVPDCVDDLLWAPVVFVRISKAGKCIGRKFVERYYDSFNFGALLYTGDCETAFSSCADHTSLLPLPLYDPVVMESEANGFVVSVEGETIFSTQTEKDIRNILEESICLASQMTSLRIGDFVAVELAAVAPIASRKDNAKTFRTEFCENKTYDIKIVF